MCKEIIHNKLVRDRIPEILASKNVEGNVRILNEVEYTSALKQKLTEEVNELINSLDDESFLEEMADVLEVMHALLSNKKQSFAAVETMRQNKFEKRGGFNKKIFLEKTL